jgi:hypothetical protein
VTELILQLQGRVASAPRVILVGDWSAEEGHDPVTGVLVDRPFESVNTFAEDPAFH